MKICMLCFHHTVADWRVFQREAVSLVEAGHEVTILGRESWDRTGGWSWIGGLFAPPEEGSERGVRTVAYRNRPRSTLLRLLTDWLWFFRYVPAALRVRAEVYHCHEPQSLLIGFIVAPLRKARLVLDAHEYQPESWAEFLGRRLYAPATRCFRRLERFAVRRVYGVITVNEELGERFRADAGRVVVLPNYPPRSVCEQPPDESLVSELRQKYAGKHVLCYQGSLSRARGLPACVEVMRHLTRELADVHLLIIGSNAAPGFIDELRSRIDDLELGGVVEMLPWMDYGRLRCYMAVSALGLFLPDPANDRYRRAEPVKFFDFAFAGVPVVLSDVPAIRELVEKVGNGILVDPERPGAAARSIAELLRDDAKLAAMAQRGRQAAVEELNWEAVAERLKAFYAAG